MKIFREICRSQGIGAAAKRLHLQQPTVSLALRRLEEHVGEKLCLRTARGIELTAAGHVLSGLCDRVFDAVQSLPNEFARSSGDVQGLLVIRTVSGVVSAELDATLDTMRRRHPGIRLKIDVAPCPIVIDALAKSRAEVCISFDAAPRAEFLYEPLVREYQQLYCASSSPLYGSRVTRPEVLAEERFILTGSDEPMEVRNFRLRFGLGLRPAGEADNLDEAKRMIRAGVGIGFLPTILVAGDEHHRLWPLLPSQILPNYCLYLITHPEAQQTVPTQLFLREIRRRISARGIPV
ncbi:MAG: LysR family transcriptional regulator [Hyphomicrobium sp.]|uniref:LysR family transcriptional regulator n=1 Tax=Hyphomicrobium sp. TaxID=82 RepID=UPI0039E43B23